MTTIISESTRKTGFLTKLLAPLAHFLARKADSKPYFDLFDKKTGELYMRRGWIKTEPGPMARLFGIDYKARIHSIHRSDKERALHCHPWRNISFVLKGGYWEVVPKDPARYEQWLEKNALNPQDSARSDLVLKEDAEPFYEDLFLLKTIWRGPGSLVFRSANARHRLIVPNGSSCLSLFITFKKIKPWGFYTERGFSYWREYLDEWEGLSESEGFKRKNQSEVAQ